MEKGIPELYGSLVFNDKVMRDKLPRDIYKALRKTIENNTHLELDVANSVAVDAFHALVPADDRFHRRKA